MEAKAHEIAPDIFRFSTRVDGVTPDGLTFNQFLIRVDERSCATTALLPREGEKVARSGG